MNAEALPSITKPAGSNRELFGASEFEAWAKRSALDAAEACLLRTYLSPTLQTVEAGTGGGRILFALADLGYSKLHGFDYVPEMVLEARARDRGRQLKLSAQDATQLAYADASFDQLIYMQQILSLMETPAARRRAIEEAFRILRPGGIALFSFLSYDVRSRSTFYRIFLRYLKILRFVRRSSRDPQTWPWLRLGGRFNRKALWDASPYVYWHRAEEAANELQRAGFRLRGIASGAQLEQGRLCTTPDELLREPMQGALFCACAK